MLMVCEIGGPSGRESLWPNTLQMASDRVETEGRHDEESERRNPGPARDAEL
jgi:hypothetical protein